MNSGPRSPRPTAIAVLLAACMALPGCTEDFCRQAEESERVLGIYVDNDIFLPEVDISGECTDLVVARHTQDAKHWQARMTGDLDSSCTVRVVSGSQLFEQKAWLRQNGLCPEYLHARSVHFFK